MQRIKVKRFGHAASLALVVLLFASQALAQWVPHFYPRNDRSCADLSGHKASFVRVEPGVQLEVLDWGGSGETLVLLTGLGDNAHVYDHFAYQFTDSFHAIGIERRGFGRSSQPGSGDLLVAFSTADPGVVKANGPTQLTMLLNHLVDSLFEAVVDAAEEAIVNTLIAAETMTGADGYTVPALSHDKLVEILKQHDRLTKQ